MSIATSIYIVFNDKLLFFIENHNEANCLFAAFKPTMHSCKILTVSLSIHIMVQTDDNGVKRMRSIDQLKIDRIHKATMDIVYSEGFENISLRQIAQIAKVSSGTPYVYYKDKQDLLTNLCYLCLDHVNDGLQNSLHSAVTLKEKLYACIFDLVCKFCDVPLMVKYVIKFRDIPELYTDEVREHYVKVDFPLDALCREAISSGQAKTSDLMLMHVMLLAPVIRLFDAYEGRDDQFNPDTYAECVRLSVESVLL